VTLAIFDVAGLLTTSRRPHERPSPNTVCVARA
jgi:hypothetical protein